MRSAFVSLRLPIAILVASATGQPTLGQEPAFNAEMLGHFVQGGQVYGDVWGEGDFAYVGHWGQNRVDIVDISDPQAPVLADTYVVAAPDGGASAQDVKVHDGLMFVSLESSSTTSVQIVDVRDATNATLLTDIRLSGFAAIHNTFYDQGWLYIVDSGTPTIRIVDLRGYDPDNPPTLITSSTWTVNNVGLFVHDITVLGGRLYAAAWNSLRIYDVTNLASQAPIFLGSVAGTSLHSSWPTGDGRFVVTAEERTGGGLSLYEITDGGGSVSLALRDTYAISTTRAISVHNPVVIGDLVYASFYQAGVHVLRIDADAGTMDLVSSFDTTSASGGGFNGCWGVFPLQGSQRVLASDIGTGLWILEQPQTIGARFCAPVANSTGQTGLVTVLGSEVVADDDLTLFATQLPPEFNIGYFIMGTGTNTFTPPGSVGPICVTPGLLRLLPPVSNTNEGPGSFTRAVGTSGLQTGDITPGSTWSFQAWHRDSMAGTSNLTDAVSVTFN